MKTKITLLISMIILINSCNGNNKFSKADLAKNIELQERSLKGIQQNDTLLNHIEQKINTAFVKARLSQSDSELINLEQVLLKLNEKKANSIIIYWYSYASYYHSIHCLIQKDKKMAEKVLDNGIAQLEEIDSKSSEQYALLALMESFSIQFAAGLRVPFISSSVKKNAEKALELDSLNLRAFYVLGSNDFYTPEQYGGGKKAEGFLRKATTLNDQTIKNEFLPSWGKNQAFEMLIKLYLKHNRLDEAKKCFQQAIALFPNDYMINKLASELIK